MTSAPWRENWVIARDIKTRYAEAGEDGPTLVMLHGGGVVHGLRTGPALGQGQ